MTANLLHDSALSERRYAQEAAADGVITFSISPQHDAVRSSWIRVLLASLESEIPVLFRESPSSEAEFRFDVELITATQWGEGSATRFSQVLGDGSFRWLSAKDTRQYGGVQDQLYLSKLILRSLGLSYPDGDPFLPGETESSTLLSYNPSPFGSFGHTFYPTHGDIIALRAIHGAHNIPVSSAISEHIQTSDEQLLIGRDGVIDVFRLSIMGVDPSSPSSITFDEYGPIYNDYRSASIAQFNPWEGDLIVIDRQLFGDPTNLDVRFAQAFTPQDDRNAWLSDATFILNDAGKLLLNVNGPEPGLCPSLLGINDYLVAFLDVTGDPSQALPSSAFLLTAPGSNSYPQFQDLSVFRLYHQQTGLHLFSANPQEIDSLTGLHGWTSEGLSYVSPKDGSASLYRFYVQGENRHFYTASSLERDFIRSSPQLQHYIDEGPSHRVIPVSSTVPSVQATAVVRYLNLDSGQHLFSTSLDEQMILNQSPVWQSEGIAWYAI